MTLVIPWTRQKRQDNRKLEGMSGDAFGVKTIKNWATSAGGHGIDLYKSADQGSSPILFLGGVHGDEPEGVWLAEITLQVLQNHKTQTCYPWYLIPCLNPDGYKKNERVNANGVDINRNFPEKNWSSLARAPRYNPGPHPASEPEVKALTQLIDEIKPRIIIHCHSWKPCIVLTGNREFEIAKALSRSSGYEFKHEIGYPTPGSLGEYGWKEKSIPVICIEVEEKIAKHKIEPLFSKSIEEIFIERVGT